MQLVLTIIKKFVVPAMGTYAILCLLAYQFQEKLIFSPDKLSADYTFNFTGIFSEEFIPASDGVMLHGLLFKAAEPRGLIFYLHGNAGAADTWGSIYPLYTSLGYDFFVLDYRGYGKSEGEISSEQQFYDDADVAYRAMMQRYPADSIVIIGYSLGSAPAVQLAAAYSPRTLILKAPFYSLSELAGRYYPIIPKALLKYKFENYTYLNEVTAPVAIFHGDKDEIVPVESSLKLRNYLKPDDVFVTLPGQFHNGMNYNQIYLSRILTLLVTFDE